MTLLLMMDFEFKKYLTLALAVIAGLVLLLFLVLAVRSVLDRRHLNDSLPTLEESGLESLAPDEEVGGDEEVGPSMFEVDDDDDVMAGDGSAGAILREARAAESSPETWERSRRFPFKKRR